MNATQIRHGKTGRFLARRDGKTGSDDPLTFLLWLFDRAHPNLSAERKKPRRGNQRNKWRKWIFFANK